MCPKRGFDENTYLIVTRQIVTPDAPSVRSVRL